MVDKSVRAAVIGGSGFYQMDGLSDVEDGRIDTPFGLPSDNLIGKHVLEGVGRRVDADNERPEPGHTPGDSDSTAGARQYASPGGADALLRP